MTNNFATGVAGAALVIAVLALFVSLRDDNDPAPAQADVTTVAPGTTSAIIARPVPTTASNTLTVSGTVPVVTAAPGDDAGTHLDHCDNRHGERFARRAVGIRTRSRYAARCRRREAQQPA